LSLGGRTGSNLMEGSFSIWNWQGYPSGLPKPRGPFRLLRGEEYDAARAAANRANKALNKELEFIGKEVDIHEITPVKFGGSPTNINNKIFLDRKVHQTQVTPFWNNIMKSSQ
jgi:filamentous hemagglutinin